ncbi:MAG: endonuclease/exonuclease/phosphatase family protein [Armatimonadota bacterium]|jgi:endonuclease/exonuclease/phosphatase family metal-dependent hydrolase
MSKTLDSRAVSLSSRRSALDLADRVRAVLAALSLAWCAFLSVLYLLRPSGWDPITIWPFIFWAWIGVVFGLASLSRRGKRRSLLVAVIWVIALVSICEEPRSVLRSVGHGGEKAWQSARAEGRALRVVSLNCGGGVLAAAREAFAREPDIVLLQERPGMDELEDVFTKADGWHGTASFDTAIFVRGDLESLPVAPRQRVFISRAAVEPSALDPPRELEVASIHLALPATRADIWRPSTWRVAEQIRQVRANQIEAVTTYAAEATGQPSIVGGDFNTPGGDGLLRPLRAHLRDAFREAGIGWPNTMVNETPISRIDQVWLSPELEATTLRVLPTQNSDHRMVVCEVALPE